ncbi:organ specific protein [Tanacetum coccineum]
MCVHDQIVSYNEARSNPREFWRSIMKDEPMPKTIQDVLPLGDVEKINKNIFMKNFDLKPNLIIYHTHVVFTEKNHHVVSSSSSSNELNSSYASAMIELRADVELKDSLMDVVPKFVSEGYPMTLSEAFGSPNTTPLAVRINELDRQILDGKLVPVDDD